MKPQPKKKPKIIKQEKLSTITNRLDKLVSQIVRLRDGKCVTCDSTINQQCGHYISRVFVNVRWDLRNCNCQCSACNVSHEQDPVPYTQWIQNIYGWDVWHELSKKAHDPHKVTRQERLLIEVGLRELLKELEEKKYGMY